MINAANKFKCELVTDLEAVLGKLEFLILRVLAAEHSREAKKLYIYFFLLKVMQLEVVRPDDSTNQDQLQEAAVGTSVIVIIVICSIVGVTILFLLFFFVRLSLFAMFVVGSLVYGLP